LILACSSKCGEIFIFSTYFHILFIANFG
jgi:hypothetical protein